MMNAELLKKKGRPEKWLGVKYRMSKRFALHSSNNNLKAKQISAFK